MSAGPLHRLSPAERRRRLDVFAEGAVVTVTFAPLRDETVQEVVGRVVGVAWPITGAQTDALILRTAGHGLCSFSTATIVDVELVAERQEARA